MVVVFEGAGDVQHVTVSVVLQLQSLLFGEILMTDVQPVNLIAARVSAEGLAMQRRFLGTIPASRMIKQRHCHAEAVHPAYCEAYQRQAWHGIVT